MNRIVVRLLLSNGATHVLVFDLDVLKSIE